MNDFCNEIDYMNISTEYIAFIRDVYNDYIKFIKQYKIVSSDYKKKLDQFQEKYNFQIYDINNKSKSKKKYNSAFSKLIFPIISSIPIILKQVSNNLELSINSMERVIKVLENTLKEKINLAIKYQDTMDENKANLVKNYKELDKLKESYMSSMSNTEDLLLKFYNSTNKKKNKIIEEKEKMKIVRFERFSIKDQMSNSMSNSKKLENQYLSCFNAIEVIDKKYNDSWDEIAQNMKKISYVYAHHQ